MQHFNRNTNNQSGVTLLEMVVVIAIIAIIIVPLMGIMGQVVAIPGRWRATLDVTRDARYAVRTIADDARRATEFVPVPDDTGEYGSFRWTDHTGAMSVTTTVRYFYETSTRNLVRQEFAGDSEPRARTVIGGLENTFGVSIDIRSAGRVRVYVEAYAEAGGEDYRHIEETIVFMRASVQIPEAAPTPLPAFTPTPTPPTPTPVKTSALFPHPGAKAFVNTRRDLL